MKKVSFEVAKAIKEAGYPQPEAEGAIVYSEQGNFCITNDEEVLAYPTYMEVWLWLWREKGFFVKVMLIGTMFIAQILERKNNEWHSWGIALRSNAVTDPEEAIIAAIEYLIKNGIIK